MNATLILWLGIVLLGNIGTAVFLFTRDNTLKIDDDIVDLIKLRRLLYNKKYEYNKSNSFGKSNKLVREIAHLEKTFDSDKLDQVENSIWEIE